MQAQRTIRLYNTYSREIEPFTPLEDKRVKIYTCGPTVYDYAHIGHIRKYIVDDVLVRMLRYLAYDVTHVMNITDVGHLVSDADTGEDKMEKGARREGKSAWEIAKFYEKHFFKSMEAVNVGRPDIVCRATEHIQEMIDLVKKLEEKGFTYKIDDGIYFNSEKFDKYGKFAGLDREGQKAGARVESVPGKKHPADFALWKLTPSGVKRDMEWDSPWGRGFPGWHIECSAMSMKYLGSTFDIHTGGIDHIPIHHPNEIAQSECATGSKFVRYWLHYNFVMVDGKKMSKSEGNYYKLEDIVQKGFDPLALRYLFLQTHYRQESNFTLDAMKGAQAALTDLRSYVGVIRQQTNQGERHELSQEKLDKVNSLRKRFKDVIRYDLNTPQALAIMWEMIKTNIPAGDKLDVLMIADEILGLGLNKITGEETQAAVVPKKVEGLMNKRNELRLAGKYDQADATRVQIEKLGYQLEDTANGTVVKKSPTFEV